MSSVGGVSGSTEGSTDHPAAPLSSTVLGIAIVAITGMQLMSTLDGTIVIVALPRMQAELDLTDVTKSWIITAYVLTFGGPGFHTTPASFHIWRRALEQFDVGRAAAETLIFTLVVGVVTLPVVWLAKRTAKAEAGDA